VLVNRISRAMYQADPNPDRYVFKIRYRVRWPDGKWNQKAETL